MANLNKVTLIGRLGADPELRSTPNGRAVTTFRMATSESYNDKSGNRQETTEWHSVVVWGKLAPIAAEHLRKGRLVLVEGKIKSREYEDRDKIKRKVTEINAFDFWVHPTVEQDQAQGQWKDDRPSFNSSKQTRSDDEFPAEAEDDVPM